jgi:alpha-L-rhamnosidase
LPSHAHTALNRNGWNRYEVTCVKDLIRIEVSGIETARVRDMVFIAHADWMHTGDAAWLAHRYESLKTKTLLHRTGDDGLVRNDQQDRSRHDLGDWSPQERDGFVFTEINTVVNAFHIEAMKRMAVMARGLGKDDEAAAFDNRVRLASEAFQATLFNDATGLYRDGVGTDHSSVHANLFPLAFGLVPKPQQPAVIDCLEEQGMKWSMPRSICSRACWHTAGASRPLP